MTDSVYDLVQKLGIYNTYHGYKYLACAIELAMQDEDKLYGVTKHLYPEVAKRFNTTPARVERNLRTVVSICWDHGNRELLEKIAGFPLDSKPTTSQFIGILVSYLLKHTPKPTPC